MNLFFNVVLVLAAAAAIYGVVVALMTRRAINQKRYLAYKQLRSDFDRLDNEVNEVFKGK